MKNRLNLEIYWLGDEADAESALKQTPTNDTKAVAELKERIAKDKNSAGTSQSLEEVKRTLLEKQNQLGNAQRQIDQIENAMNTLLDIEKPQQDFKTTISAYFTALVAILIVGFFIIAGIDQQVRREIFAGQAGIQFVTLFSLVVAIILFGITGILEGKELSALLGGLSGYILGRSTSKENPVPSTNPPPPPPPAPAPP